jgi:hypothetical protein
MARGYTDREALETAMEIVTKVGRYVACLLLTRAKGDAWHVTRLRGQAVYLAHVCAKVSQCDIAQMLGYHRSTINGMIIKVEALRDDKAYDAKLAEQEEDLKRRLAQLEQANAA